MYGTGMLVPHMEQRDALMLGFRELMIRLSFILERKA